MRQRHYKPTAARVIDRFARRKLLIFTVFIFVVVSGMLTTFLITPKYDATMSILVSRDRIDPQINPSDRSHEITQTAISDEEFNSELELVGSVEVVTGAVKDLDLVNDRKPKSDTWLSDLRGRVKTSIYEFGQNFSSRVEAGGEVLTQTETSFSVEKAVNNVLGNLEVVPVKKSRIIKIRYVDTDPLRAKKTLEKIYEKYVDLHVRMKERPAADGVFQDQTDRFSEKLSTATNEIRQFDSQYGVSGAEIGTQRELLLKQLYDTQAQVNSTRTEIGELEQRITSLRSKIDTMPEQIEVSSVSRYVGALDMMKEELVKLEQQRTELLQKYKPNSRFVRENEERIQQLRKNIATETASPPQEKSYALNDLRRNLEGELNAAQTNIGGLKKREKSLSAQASKLSEQVVALNDRSIQRDSLERQRTINEEAYLLYQKKSRENEISQVLNKERVLNFGLIDAPRTDGEQKTPKPLLNLIVLMGVGLFAGLGVALFWDSGTEHYTDDDLILDALDFERRFGLPVLASVPMIEEPRSQGRLRLKD